MMRKFLFYKKGIAAALSIALLFSMMPGQVSDAKTKKPALNYKKLTMTVGQKKTLKVKNVSKKTKIKWSSSKKKIVTVTKKGVVKAKAKGKAVITAKIGKKKYTCKITVKAKKKKAATTNTNTNNVTNNPQTTVQPVAPAVPTVSKDPGTTATPGNSTPVPDSTATAPDSTASTQPEVTKDPSQTATPDTTADPEETEEPTETDSPYPSIEPDEDGLKEAVEVKENVSSQVTFTASEEGETSYSYVKFVPSEDGLYKIRTDVLGSASDQTDEDEEDKIAAEFGTEDIFSDVSDSETITESYYECGDYEAGEGIDFRPHTILKANTAYYLRVNTPKTYETNLLIEKNAFPQDAKAFSTSETTIANISQYCSTYYLNEDAVEAGHEGYFTFTPDRDGYYQFRQAVSDYDDVTTETVYPVRFKIFENGTDCLARQNMLADGEINYEESYTEESEYISYKCLEKMKAGTTYYIALEDQKAGDVTMSVVKYDVPGFSDTVSTNLTLAANETTRIIFTPSETGYYKFSTVSKMTSDLQVEMTIGSNTSIYTYVGESLALDWVAEYVKFTGGQKYYIDFTSEGAQTLQTLKAEKFDAELLETAVAKKVNVKFGQDTILKFTPSESGIYQLVSAENCYVDMDIAIYDTMPDYEAVNGDTQLDEIVSYYSTAGEALDWELDESLDAGQTYYIVISAGTDDDEQYVNQNLNFTMSKYVDDEE